MIMAMGGGGDMIIHDMNEEQDEADNDEIEDFEQMMFENNVNGIEEDDMRCQDVDEAYKEHDGSEDEDMDDRENDSENEDDELLQEQHEGPQLEKEAASFKKRGQTMMHLVHTRKIDAPEVIICNEFGQPIGPTTDEIDIVGRFSRFLGTIARTYIHAPLTYDSWHKVPDKDRMWEYVLGKYIVTDDAKPWVLKSIGASWRGYKCRLKKNHFYKFKDNKTRWQNRPECIPAKEFLKLLTYWNKKDVTKYCSLKRKVCMSQKNMHTVGPKSFARIREEMKNEDPEKESPTLTKLFERTRLRKEGRLYVDTFDDTAKKIEQMKNYEPREDESAPVDPFLAVMNKEYDGHRRLYGKGVTNKVLKKVNGCETSYMLPRDVVESYKDGVEAEKFHNKDGVEAEKNELIDMRREHENKKAELEAIQKNIDNHRDKLVEDVVQKILEKLPREVIQKFLL